MRRFAHRALGVAELLRHLAQRLAEFAHELAESAAQLLLGLGPLAVRLGFGILRIFAACLAVAACTGVTTWGIDDGSTWLDTFSVTAGSSPNEPLLFDAAGQPKPAYQAVVQTLRAAPEPGAPVLLLMSLAALARRRTAPRSLTDLSKVELAASARRRMPAMLSSF